MSCTPKRLKVCSILSCICFVIFLALAIALPFVIESFIVTEAKGKALMQTSNQNLWGEVPGDSQAQITRVYKFYNFSNPDEFLFENKTPVFDEIGDFTYQEIQNFTDYEFVTDNETGLEKINYNFFQHFKPLTGNMDTNVTVMNLGALGAWYQFKTSPKKKVAVQAMAGIIYTLEDYVMLVASAQGIFGQFIQTKENLINTVFKPAGNVPETLYDSLWDDAKYGWSNWTTLRRWIRAAQNGVTSYDSYVIRDYFELSYAQMYALLSGAFNDWVVAIPDLLKQWYCEGQDPCDGPYLTAMQLARQGITMHPPAGTGVNATASVVTTNDTLRGCPEASLFLTEVFLKQEQYNTSDYRNVSFSVDWMLGFINHTRNLSEPWMRDEHIILHVGNIDFLFTEGAKFYSSGNLSDFESIRTRFRLDTLYQAHVLYEWINYVADEFAMQKSRNGTMDQASIGSFLSLEMVRIYDKANDYLLLEVLSNIMLYNYTNRNITCVDMMNASSLDLPLAEKVCSVVPEFNNTWNLTADSMKKLIYVCWYKRDYSWNNFAEQTNLTNMQIEFICDSVNSPDNRSFGRVKAWADQRLHDHYNCDKVSLTCSQNEFTAKQWGSSEITRNVPFELSSINKKFVNTTTTVDWEPTLITKPWEYFAVIDKYPNFTTNNTIMGVNTTVSRKLLTFDRLFNQMIRFVIIDYNFNYTDDIVRLFQSEDPKALYNYLKYMMITHAFYGFTTTKSVKELLWGYTDPFITKIKNGDPQQGGDPSLPDVVSLQTNITYDLAKNNTQSVFSGKGDISKVRTYKEVYGVPYITFNDTAFNGNDSYITYTNPWVDQVEFGGTDSFGNSPNLDKSSTINVYVTDLYRGGYGQYRGETQEYNGVECLRFRLPDSYMQNKTQNPANAPYYMDRWNGLLNLTTAKKLPLMMSTYSHYQLDEDAYKNVVIYQNNRTNTMVPDAKYNSYMDIEPYSGAGISAYLHLQAHIEYQADNLFSNPNYALLPVFALQRSGSWSDSGIDTQFSLLKLGLKMKLILQILFYVFAGILLILASFMIYKYKKTMRRGKEGTLLPSSTGEIKIDDRVL